MKPSAADRPNPRHRGPLLVALCAAALLVLAGGCGNDEPYDGGISLRYQFADTGSQPASGGYEPAVTGPQDGSETVPTLVIGAIIIRHNKVDPSLSAPVVAYTNEDVTLGRVGEPQRAALQNDAEASVKYLTLVQLPTPEESVEFLFPLDNAGSWQLIGVGLRNQRTSLSDIQNVDPIWYGFIPTFLNGLVTPGQVIEQELVLQPWCEAALPLHPSCP